MHAQNGSEVNEINKKSELVLFITLTPTNPDASSSGYPLCGDFERTFLPLLFSASSADSNDPECNRRGVGVRKFFNQSVGPQYSAFCPLSSDLSFPIPIFCLLSPVFCFLPPVFHPLSSLARRSSPERRRLSSAYRLQP
jgi:hypothetical protein